MTNQISPFLPASQLQCVCVIVLLCVCSECLYAVCEYVVSVCMKCVCMQWVSLWSMSVCSEYRYEVSLYAVSIVMKCLCMQWVSVWSVSVWSVSVFSVCLRSVSVCSVCLCKDVHNQNFHYTQFYLKLISRTVLVLVLVVGLSCVKDALSATWNAQLIKYKCLSSASSFQC